ncbi:hypothetical protein ACTA71_002464 [Dictyostelium dimigraforme]
MLVFDETVFQGFIQAKLNWMVKSKKNLNLTISLEVVLIPWGIGLQTKYFKYMPRDSTRPKWNEIKQVISSKFLCGLPQKPNLFTNHNNKPQFHQQIQQPLQQQQQQYQTESPFFSNLLKRKYSIFLF